MYFKGKLDSNIVTSSTKIKINLHQYEKEKTYN